MTVASPGQSGVGSLVRTASDHNPAGGSSRADRPIAPPEPVIGYRRPSHSPSHTGITPSALWNGRDPQPLQQPAQHLLFERLPPAVREHERAGAVAMRPRRVEDLDGAAAPRNAVLAVRLHPRCRDGPHVGLCVHLGPSRPAPPCRRQHEKLERELDGLGRVRRPQRRDRRRHVPTRQRPHVPHDLVLLAEHRSEPVARVVHSQVPSRWPTASSR